jgi:hypothetical protein
MYTDYYLRFESEADAQAVLYTEEPSAWDEAGHVTETTLKSNFRNIDVLGTLYAQQATQDPENPPEPVAIDGWHVNVRTLPDEDGAPLEAYRVDPEPQVWRRVWG